MRGPADRGRRSPQPRGMDRRYPPAAGQRFTGDRRRQRSISPGRGRSPVHYKRMRGADGPYDQPRYDERDFDAAYDDPRGGYSEHYARPASPRGPKQVGPKSYKLYMMELPDDITPEDAQKKYDEYLTLYWGSARKAYFQGIKDKPETKAKFHPLEQAKGKKVRNDEAQEAAKKFSERLLSGGLNPAAEDFNQGEGPSETKSGDTAMAEDGGQPAGDASSQPPTQVAPALLWKPERVAADLKLSRQLIEKLDEEKGIVSNPLIAADQLNGTADQNAKEEKPAAAQVADGEIKPDSSAPTEDTDMAAADPDAPPKEAEPKAISPTKTDYQMSVKTDEKSAAVSDSQAGDASTHEATTEVKAAAQVKGGSSDASTSEDVGKLDIHLTYLWEVHRVNFYVGGEWWDPSDRQRWASQRRMVRAPHPEEGEQPDAEQEKLESAQVKKMVDQVWQTRLASGDPLEALLHTEEIDKAVDKWVEDRVVKHSDTKWGNTLSAKMFVGKDFVLKHIRTKHAEKVDEYKIQMYEDLYWRNYDDMESNRIELAKQAKREARLAAEAANKEEDLETPMELQQGSGFPGLAARNTGDADEQGGHGDHANGVQRSGSGMGRNGPKGGRGRPGRGRGQMGMRGDMGMGGPMAPMGAGMMGGMQAMPGQMFVLAPGAGPLGPFVQVPIPAGGPEPMGMGPQMGGGLQRGGSRGPARAPRSQPGRGGYGGGGPMPMGGRGYAGRGYFDLDAPENQRSVLDYGDL